MRLAATAGEHGSIPTGWSPPYALQGDTWCALALARAAGIQGLLPDTPVWSLAGWAPLVLQATRYRTARSLGTLAAEPEQVSYTEISVMAFGRGRPAALVPLRLLVDNLLARDIGLAYGFPKVLCPGLQVRSGTWTLLANAGDGRVVSGARGLGAAALVPLGSWLKGRAFRVELPARATRTRMVFERIQRLGPALITVSGPMRRWAGVAGVLPLGLAMQKFVLRLEEPTPA